MSSLQKSIPLKFTVVDSGGLVWSLCWAAFPPRQTYSGFDLSQLLVPLQYFDSFRWFLPSASKEAFGIPLQDTVEERIETLKREKTQIDIDYPDEDDQHTHSSEAHTTLPLITSEVEETS